MDKLVLWRGAVLTLLNILHLQMKAGYQDSHSLRTFTI